MKSSSLPYLLTLIVVLGSGYGFYRAWQTLQHDEVAGVGFAVELTPADRYNPDAPPITTFQLTDSRDETFDSQVMQGQVWVASFFFTTCPSTCVRLNQALQGLQQDESLDEVKFVSITCDPEYDTPEVLAQYAERFKADPERWYFCTGEFDYLKQIGNDVMKLVVERQTHANHAVVIDRAGKVRGRFDVIKPAELTQMKQAMREALAEPAPEPAESPAEQGSEISEAGMPVSEAAESSNS